MFNKVEILDTLPNVFLKYLKKIQLRYLERDPNYSDSFDPYEETFSSKMDDKGHRMACARAFLQRFRRDGDRLLDRIITGDEAWV